MLRRLLPAHVPGMRNTSQDCSQKHTGGERWVLTPLVLRRVLHILGRNNHRFAHLSAPEEEETSAQTVLNPRVNP